MIRQRGKGSFKSRPRRNEVCVFKLLWSSTFPVRWQRKVFLSLLQQKPVGKAEITWLPAKLSGDAAWQRRGGECLCISGTQKKIC